MKVHLTRTTHFRSSELSRVHDLLCQHAGPMEFKLSSGPILFERQDYRWDDLFTVMNEFRKAKEIPDDEYLACVTELRNSSNWFSAFDPKGTNNIFVHGDEWDYYVYAEPRYPIAFEIVLNVLQRKLFPDFEKLDGHPLIHDFPRGCINDMCIDKTEIGFKMRTADICNDCSRALDEVLGDRAVLEQTVLILEHLRRGMIQSRVYLNPLSFEARLPFSVAITKRRMGMTTQTFRKFLTVIDHFDSLVRTTVIMVASLYQSNGLRTSEFFEENSLNSKPALGTWVSALAKLSNMTVDSDLIALAPDFKKKLQRVVTLEQEKKIVWIRNEKRGHGYIECDDEGYEEELLNLLPVLHEMEQSLAPLFERFYYYFIRKLERVGNEIVIYHTDLSGSNPAFLETTSNVAFEKITDIPEGRKCYLVTPDKKTWTSLDPYLKFGTCPECKHPRLLIQDGETYLDPFVGHRVELNNLHERRN